MMMTTDVALWTDSAYREIVTEFANNIDSLNVAFANAWAKLTSRGRLTSFCLCGFCLHFLLWPSHYDLLIYERCCQKSKRMSPSPHHYLVASVEEGGHLPTHFSRKWKGVVVIKLARESGPGCCHQTCSFVANYCFQVQYQNICVQLHSVYINGQDSAQKLSMSMKTTNKTEQRQHR